MLDPEDIPEVCNLLAPCRRKDRVISKMPRKAFEFLTGEDEPDTSVICGENGPGFYPRLMLGPQWSMELYDLNLELQPFDFMHYQSCSSVSCVRKLLLGHCDVLRFGLGLASGEYVPWSQDRCHDSWKCHTIYVRCLSCGKSPAGDHCRHENHHKNKTFRQRNNGYAPKCLAMLTDVVNAQIDQCSVSAFRLEPFASQEFHNLWAIRVFFPRFQRINFVRNVPVGCLVLKHPD